MEGSPFVGHGAFGILTKQGWVPDFGVYGIPEVWAWQLRPLVGSVDILLETLALVALMRAALLYMAFWGLFTASLRPSAGEGWWELFEWGSKTSSVFMKRQALESSGCRSPP